MTNKLSNEEINIYKKFLDDSKCSRTHLTSPREIIVLDKALTELLAYREAESEPVAIVETSDRMTFAQLVGTEPRRKAVRELYEGGLVIGQKLYVSPALGQTPIITEQHKAVIESLLKLAYAAWDACDDSEQVNDGVEEYHKIIPRTFDLISDALDELEALPNDQPGFDMQAAAQARWALRDILVESASQVLGQTSESINSELLEASQPVVPNGYCLMPLTLTAENGAKNALTGEFHTIEHIGCVVCGGDGIDGDDECDNCDGSGDVVVQAPVSWNTIKDIYKAAVKCCAIQSFGNSEQLNYPEIPEGWKLVPVEPTDEMIAAGDECWMMTESCADSTYRAMLNAAPALQEGE